jgi:hypothetical protein
VALVAAVVIATALASYGLEGDYPAETRAEHRAALIFGAIALLGAALDLRMVRRGGLRGGERIARHLWRMGVTLYIAASSLFLGQEQAFPEAVRGAGVLVLPGLLVALTTGVYLVRTLVSARRGGATTP